MSANNFTYRPQNVDYLGFLEAQLRDLQGIAILAYELIPDADLVYALPAPSVSVVQQKVYLPIVVIAEG